MRERERVVVLAFWELYDLVRECDPDRPGIYSVSLISGKSSVWSVPWARPPFPPHRPQIYFYILLCISISDCLVGPPGVYFPVYISVSTAWWVPLPCPPLLPPTDLRYTRISNISKYIWRKTQAATPPSPLSRFHKTILKNGFYIYIYFFFIYLYLYTKMY